MSAQIEKIVQVYKTLSKIPSIVGGRLNTMGNKVSSRWSIRNIDKGKNSQYVIDYALDSDLKVIATSDFGVDVSNELLSAVSPKETYKAVIREDKSGKDKKCLLEVWSRNSLAHSIDLTALDIHGDVYADGEFGSLDWSPDEKSVIYIAEQKPKKSEPFIKRKPVDKNGADGDKKIIPGEEHIYKPDWGEQLVGKKHSVIVKCDIESEAVSVLEGIPENMCPGQVRFSADGKGVIGVVWETDDPSRLGLIFCTNRLSHIFWLSFDGTYRRLSKPVGAVRSPRVCPGGVVWLQRDVGGPHASCLQIVKLDNSALESIINSEQISDSKEEMLLDIVQEKMDITNGVFYGMYGQSLPKNCFSGNRLLFNTITKNEVRSYVLDMESKKITDISLSGHGSTSILCVQNDIVLATFSNITTPGQLYIATLPPSGLESTIEWKRLSEPNVVAELSAAKVQYMDLEHTNDDDVKSFNSILVCGEEKRPLIVWPHGGPHSAFVNAYALETAFFYLLGFASVQINYRGSLGYGEKSVRFLPSRIGSADVIDCKMATDECLKHAVNGQLCLYGGSHGGFLVAHLSGQYPDVYNVVVSRNPVIDCSSMAGVTDIPDWCYIESGLNYHESGAIQEEELLAMRRCSPIVHAHRVRAPTALMLGSNDKRVPYYQGLEYAKRLKANGAETRVFVYEDNHSLSSQTAEMDNLINGAHWFITHLNN